MSGNTLDSRGAPRIVPVERGVLFAASHALSSFFVDDTRWRDSLILNLLFQHKVHIPDNGLLGAPRVTQHLKNRKGNESWLEKALVEHILVPHFRESKSYTDQLHELTKLRGLELNQEQVALAQKLDKHAVEPEIWPPSVGRAYKDLLDDRLRASDPGFFDTLADNEVGEELVSFWSRTEEWRTEWLDQSAVATERENREGIMLSILLQISADRVFEKLKIARRKVETMTEVLREVKAREPKLAQDLRIFYKIVCELYNRNHASAFGVRPNTASFDPFSDVIAKGRWVLPGADLGYDPAKYEVLGTVTLPAPNVLEKYLDGQAFFDVRRSDEGIHYRDQLRSWSGQPTDPTRTYGLFRSIQDYCAFISRTIDAKATFPKLELLIDYGITGGVWLMVPELFVLETVEEKSTAASGARALGKIARFIFRKVVYPRRVKKTIDINRQRGRIAVGLGSDFAPYL